MPVALSALAVVLALAAAAAAPAAAATPGLAFAPNRGQAPDAVRYEARAAGTSLRFSRRAARLATPGGSVSLRLRGAAPVEPRPSRRLPGTVNHLRGPDPRRWHVGLPTYGALTYANAWRGVDVRFDGEARRLKYTFTLAPRARPEAIRLAYRGARGLTVRGDGSLAVRTAAGTLTDARPVTFQRIGGQRVPVRSRFVLRGGTRFGFRVGAYDRSRPLVIDPALDFSTVIGGPGIDEANGVAVDAAGASYVAGTTADGGDLDAFVTKLAPDGATAMWTTYLGGTGVDQAQAVAVDATGAAYVTGDTASADFPATPGAWETADFGGGDAFVTKLVPAGGDLAYSTYLGGNGSDGGRAIALEGTRAWVAGVSNSADFVVTDESGYSGGGDAFVTRLPADAGSLELSTLLGGSTFDAANGIAFRDGRAHIAGVTGSDDFPTTDGAADTSYNGGASDAFLASFDAGPDPDFATLLGGTGADRADAIAVDAAGRAVVAGSTRDAGDYPTTPGAYDTSYNGTADAVLTRFNAIGTALDYSTFLGGGGLDEARGLALAGGQAVMAGLTDSQDFPTVPGAFDTAPAGEQDAFVTRLDLGTSTLANSTYLGGPARDAARAVAVDGSGRIVAAGLTESEGFPTTPGSADPSFNGVRDVFVARLGDPAPAPSPTPGGGGVPAAAAFAPSDTTLRPFQPVTFDASASQRPGSEVVSYAWDYLGDDRPEAICGAATPILQTDLSRAGAREVTLTVTDRLGTVTRAAQTVSVRRPGRSATVAAVSPRDRRRVARAVASYMTALAKTPAAALCKPRPEGNPTLDATALGGPPPGCVSELLIPDTRVAAVGCLESTAYLDLPPQERAIVDRELLGLFRGNSQLAQVESCARPPCARSSASLVGAALALEQAKQELAGVARFYVASSAVRVNGLDFRPEPAPGAGRSAVVLVGRGIVGRSSRLAYPAVVSSGVIIRAPTDDLGEIVLRRQQRLVLPINTDSEIASFPLGQSVPFAQATNLRGRLTARLRDKASELTVQAALPVSLFDKPGGGPVTGAIALRATNQDGIRLNGFEIGKPGFGTDDIDAEIAGVGVVVDYLRYQSQPVGQLAGAVRVSIPPAGRVEGELAVEGGALRRLRVAYQPGPPGIKVGPAIFLYELEAFFDDTDGLNFGGGAGLAAGAAIGNGCAPVGVKGSFDFRLEPAPITVTLRGDLSLACVYVGFQELKMAADGYAAFRVGLSDFDLGPVKLTANGDAAFYDGSFTGELDASAFLELPDPFPNVGVRGNALVSDRGLAMCVGTSLPLFGSVDVGFGLPWSPPPVNIAVLLANIDVMVPSCDTGPFRTVQIRARAAQNGAIGVELPRGESMLAVEGSGAAPRLTLRDPAGTEYAMPATGALDSAEVLAFRLEETDTTYVALKRPAAGRWTLTPADGARVAGVQRAAVLPEPRVAGRVQRRGGRWVVDYRVRRQPGQVVRLFERAPGGTRLLGPATGRRGRVRFIPSDASGSARAIVATVEQNGLPRAEVVLDRFRSGPPRIGRARGIRGRLSGKNRLTISWRRAPGAQRHLVGLELSDGRALLRRTTGRRVTVAGVRRGTRVTVRIVGARAGDARRGRVAGRRLTARRRG